MVVPSDYESLCLFAYEAGMLGQRVILNRACEAFGNGARWQERMNCLMFDGTAADLASTMREAVRWTPSQCVDSSPDEPYWNSKGIAPRSSSKKSQRLKSAVACFGFVSSEEVTRAALAVGLMPLDGAEVCFFLPRATLGPDSAAARTVINNGWNAVFLSGRGVQPRELSQRLASLDADFIILWPNGYQLHPQFISRASQAMARVPELAVYSSHVRVLDAEQRTAVGVGVYGGDTPSLALLGNVVAPPAAAVRRQVLAKHPFDDRARRLWYQAWIRNLALAGEEVLIAPEIEIDQTNPTEGNNIELCGTIIDDVGLAERLPARLMAVEPVQANNLASRYWHREITSGELQSAVCVWPQMNRIRDFPLVVYRTDAEGLMVHPIGEGPVIARVVGPGGAIRKVVAEIWNAHGGNDGVEVSVAIAEQISPELLSTLARGTSEPGVPMAEWMPVAPNGRSTVTLTSMQPPSRSNSILLMSRVAKGGREQYCHAVFTRVLLILEGGAP